MGELLTFTIFFLHCHSIAWVSNHGPLPLDDAGAFKKLLQDCAVPPPIIANLAALGYRTVALLGFALPL